LHRFRDTVTVTEYVTAYDLEKSYIFVRKVEITSHVRLIVKHITDNTFPHGMGVRRGSNNK